MVRKSSLLSSETRRVAPRKSGVGFYVIGLELDDTGASMESLFASCTSKPLRVFPLEASVRVNFR